MINAVLVTTNSTTHFLSAQLDPFVVVTNTNVIPVTLGVYGIIMSYLEDSRYEGL